MTTKDLLKRLFTFRAAQPTHVVPSGLYHTMRESDGAYTRFHLRVEPDGSGMLLANASAAARLSPSGVIMAKGLLDGDDEYTIRYNIKSQFQDATEDRVSADFKRIQGLIATLAGPGDNYPIINLDDAAFSPHAAQLMAPFEADVPLAEPERLRPIIERLWEIGIPHVTILAPQDPDAEHLVRAIERAEDTGMIAGVRARASDLAQGTLLDDLAMAGVDHITLPYASSQPETHDALLGAGDHAQVEQAIARIQDNEVSVVAEVALVEDTMDTLDATVERLSELGVTNVSFFAIAASDEMSDEQRAGALKANAMRQVAAYVEETAGESLVRYIWEPPGLRNPAQSLAEQVRHGPRCSGDVAIRVEADGTVVPPRGSHRSAGNLLNESWDEIWGNEAFRIYRDRLEAPTHCDVCPGLVICAADCPHEQSGWSQE